MEVRLRTSPQPPPGAAGGHPPSSAAPPPPALVWLPPLGLPPPLLGLPQGPPHRLQLLPPLGGQVEGLLQGTLSVALDLFGLRQGRLVVGRPTLGQCGLDSRGGRLRDQSLASVRHVGGHTGPQGLHIKSLGVGGAGPPPWPASTAWGRGQLGTLPLGVGGASGSTTTTSAPRFVCLVGLPPLGTYDWTHAAVASHTDWGASYLPTWWMPPPLCSFCPVPAQCTPPMLHQ